ncbi:hypothetical protein T440DRAFT_384416 [Plenodomus tracheiphilus IPT5]|uniref:Uncharacterized protein n=1 Tax=Plenodomus tracheiphilus IPT5 TaxID=1408161 RepID=A0A6A7BMX6_9PLEO|nr:hypothetical protein T440DRAFT_384416 [Plenodomus tracheiphilus IPT5]
MADRNGSYNRSKSMPLIGLGQIQGPRKGPDQHEWKHALLHSPGLQTFRNNTASVWAPNGVQFLEPAVPIIADKRGGDADGDDAGSQSSVSTVKMNAGVADGLNVSEEHLIQALPGPEMRIGMSSPWQRTPTNERPNSRASSGNDSDTTFVTDHSLTRSVGSVDSSGCTSSPPKHDPNLYRDLTAMLNRATVANKPHVAKVIHAPEPLQRRQASNRLSSLPAIPSPLGLSRVKNDVVSDGSGLMGSSPSSPRWLQEASTAQSPNICGLYKSYSGLEQGSPSQKTAGFSLGHGRNPTDPFVERAEKLPSGTPEAVQNPKEYIRFRSPLPLTTPDRTVSPQDPPSVPRGCDTRPPNHPNILPSAQVDLPIPPPPLPFVQHNYTYTPEARAVLDAQKVTREAWIRTEAKQITDLSRARFAAAQQYERTHSVDDYAVWSHTETAYLDATNLEKRQEERRNMFLPQGTSAMRTGPDNIYGDGSASFTPTPNQYGGGDSNGGEGGIGRLLGFQMAFMERVCAEVKHRSQDGNYGGEEAADKITAEMLDTLSIAERAALRKHLVARLQRGTDGRACN